MNIFGKHSIHSWWQEFKTIKNRLFYFEIGLEGSVKTENREHSYLQGAYFINTSEVWYNIWPRMLVLVEHWWSIGGAVGDKSGGLSRILVQRPPPSIIYASPAFCILCFAFHTQDHNHSIPATKSNVFHTLYFLSSMASNCFTSSLYFVFWIIWDFVKSHLPALVTGPEALICPGYLLAQMFFITGPALLKEYKTNQWQIYLFILFLFLVFCIMMCGLAQRLLVHGSRIYSDAPTLESQNRIDLQLNW